MKPQPDDDTPTRFASVHPRIGRVELKGFARFQCPACDGDCDTRHGRSDVQGDVDEWTAEVTWRWMDVPCEGCGALYTVKVTAERTDTGDGER